MTTLSVDHSHLATRHPLNWLTEHHRQIGCVPHVQHVGMELTGELVRVVVMVVLTLSATQTQIVVLGKICTASHQHCVIAIAVHVVKVATKLTPVKALRNVACCSENPLRVVVLNGLHVRLVNMKSCLVQLLLTVHVHHVQVVRTAVQVLLLVSAHHTLLVVLERSLSLQVRQRLTALVVLVPLGQ